jgi:hypothetical protein
LTPEDGTDRLSRNVGKDHYTLSNKSADIKYRMLVKNVVVIDVFL